MTEEDLEIANFNLKIENEQLRIMIRKLIVEPEKIIRSIAEESWDGALQFSKRMSFETFWLLKGKK